MTQYKVEDYLNLDDSQFSDSAEETGIFLNQSSFEDSFGNVPATVPMVVADVPKLSRLSELSLLPQYSSNSNNRVEKKSAQKHKKDRVLKSYVKAIDKTLETSDSSLLSSTPSPKSIFSYGFSSSLDDERAFSMVEEHLQLPQDDAYINENVLMLKIALEKSPAVSPTELGLPEADVFTAPADAYGTVYQTGTELEQLQASMHAYQHQHQHQHQHQNEPEVGQDTAQNTQQLPTFQPFEMSPLLTSSAVLSTPVKTDLFGYASDLERSLDLASMSFDDQFDIQNKIPLQTQLTSHSQLQQQCEMPASLEEEEDEEGEREEEEDEEEPYAQGQQQVQYQPNMGLQQSAAPVYRRLHEIRVENMATPLHTNALVPEKKRRKLSIQPLTFDQIRLTHGLLRKTMIRHYDTEDLKIQIKKEITKEQKAIKDALKRPEKTLGPKKRTISKTRLQNVSINFTQVLNGLLDLEVVFTNNHILSSNYWSAKGDAAGVTEMRNIVYVLRHQYRNQITFKFVDEEIDPSSVADGVKVLKFSVISRYCEHLEGDKYINGWVHLITYNDLSELLGFALDISDEMIVVNDDSLIFETQNEPWKRLLMRWRSIYDKKLFIISESKEMMQLKIEKANARGKPFNLDEREKKLKEDLFNQLMSYKGLLGAPSKTAKDQALIKTNKLQALIKVVLEKYCWVDPSKVPEGGYRRLF